MMAGGEQLGGRRVAAVDWSEAMNHVGIRQSEAGSDHGLSRLEWPEWGRRGGELRPCGGVDGAVNPSSAAQARIGRVHDRRDVRLLDDIAENALQRDVA